MTDPQISIIIPCYNEERFIAGALEQLVKQSCAASFEIVVVDGASTDETRRVIEEFAARGNVPLRVIDNPARNIPTALNLGIRAARGELIVRMDAHSAPSDNYVSRCAELLNAHKAAIVGMPWRIKPGADSLMARGIAAAVSHPLGAGDAKYRLPATGSQFVDTVPFGAFHTSLWEQLGGFNEQLLTNEDYDFNYRVRKQGGRILLDNEAYSDYFARPRLSDLARQYFRYGLWKARMVKLHPSSMKLRQIVPPLFVMALIVSALLSVFSIVFAGVLAFIAGFYLAVVLFVSFRLALRESALQLALYLPFTFVVIHFCWGSGFLIGLLR